MYLPQLRRLMSQRLEQKVHGTRRPSGPSIREKQMWGTLCRMPHGYTSRVELWGCCFNTKGTRERVFISSNNWMVGQRQCRKLRGLLCQAVQTRFMVAAENFSVSFQTLEKKAADLVAEQGHCSTQVWLQSFAATIASCSAGHSAALNVLMSRGKRGSTNSIGVGGLSIGGGGVDRAPG